MKIKEDNLYKKEKEKKSLKWVTPIPRLGSLKKGPFWAASKGRANWLLTAFSPCEAELNCTPRGPPGTPPGPPRYRRLTGCLHNVGSWVGPPLRQGFHFF